jgi:hypothetical protein
MKDKQRKKREENRRKLWEMNHEIEESEINKWYKKFINKKPKYIT